MVVASQRVHISVPAYLSSTLSGNASVSGRLCSPRRRRRILEDFPLETFRIEPFKIRYRLWNNIDFTVCKTEYQSEMFTNMCRAGRSRILLLVGFQTCPACGDNRKGWIEGCVVVLFRGRYTGGIERVLMLVDLFWESPRVSPLDRLWKLWTRANNGLFWYENWANLNVVFVLSIIIIN